MHKLYLRNLKIEKKIAAKSISSYSLRKVFNVI